MLKVVSTNTENNSVDILEVKKLNFHQKDKCYLLMPEYAIGLQVLFCLCIFLKIVIKNLILSDFLDHDTYKIQVLF